MTTLTTTCKRDVLQGCIAHKFGGSSVATAERLARVADIILARADNEPRQVVVVSAMQGVTDALIALCRKAAARDGQWMEDLQALERKHVDTAKALLAAASSSTTGAATTTATAETGEAACLSVLRRLEREFSVLAELLRAQALIGCVSNDLLDLIHGLGEVWSSLLLRARCAAAAAASGEGGVNAAASASSEVAKRCDALRRDGCIGFLPNPRA